MTKKLTVFLIASIAFFCISCEENSYSKIYTFEKNQVPNKPLEFTFENSTSKVYYDIILLITHTERIEHNQFVFDFKLHTIAGDSLSTTLGVILRSHDGKFKGKKVEDSYSISQVLMKKQRLPKGANVFSIQPAMNADTIYNISQIELTLVESDD